MYFYNTNNFIKNYSKKNNHLINKKIYKNA